MSEEEVIKLLEEIKDYGNKYLDNQYYMLYKHDIEIIIPYIEKLQQKNNQLEYLRSGEYLNQLKFERNMLENIVKYMEVSKEDKEFIDMTHRNTELLEENTQLKKEKDDFIKAIIELAEEKVDLKSVLKEIREYVNTLGTQDGMLKDYKIDRNIKEDLLEIIDKAGIGEDNG